MQISQFRCVETHSEAKLLLQTCLETYKCPVQYKMSTLRPDPEFQHPSGKVKKRNIKSTHEPFRSQRFGTGACKQALRREEPRRGTAQRGGAGW